MARCCHWQTYAAESGRAEPLRVLRALHHAHALAELWDLGGHGAIGRMHDCHALMRVPGAQGRFASFGHFTTPSHWQNFGIVAGVALALAGGLFGYREVTESRRRHKYNRALEAVQNMK